MINREDLGIYRLSSLKVNEMNPSNLHANRVSWSQPPALESSWGP